MTKVDLIERIKERLSESANTKHIHEKTVIGHVLDAFGDEAAERLAAGDDVSIPGLGKLKPMVRPARLGRNPRTGEPVNVPAKNIVKFKAGKRLKESQG